MKMKKMLSLLLAALMTVSAGSVLVANADDNADPLVIPYSKIQKGNVDNHIRCEITTAEDPEKGSVVKVSPLPNTEEAGNVVVDGYGIGGLGIDLNYYKYVIVEYKLVTDISEDIQAYLNLLPGTDHVLSAQCGYKSLENLKTNEWSTMSFSIGPVKDKVTGEKGGILQQLHFYPFGQKLTPSAFEASDYILLGNFTFTAENPNKDMQYKIEFTAGNVPTMEGTLPETIYAKVDEPVTVPEVTVSADGKETKGWLCSAGNTALKPGDVFIMPEQNVIFNVNWRDIFQGDDVVAIRYVDYFGGICDRKDTALAEEAIYEDKSVIRAIPNIVSENDGAINLDGWSYGGARIDVTQYQSLLLTYKYVSETPLPGNPQINIMKSSSFSGATNMLSPDPIRANRWTAAAFDLTPCAEKTLDSVEPTLRQLHIYPLGSNKPSTMKAEDVVYVDQIIAIKDKAVSADYHTAFIKGYEGGLFKPENNMSRAEACTIVARLACGGDNYVPTDKKSAFTDVAEGQWYTKYIATCEALGYLKGYSGAFLPDQNITRAEFAELVYNMGLLTGDVSDKTFTDVDASHPKYNVIMAAAKSGLINGSKNGDGTYSFKPDDSITRAEVVKIINNAYGKKCSLENMFEKVANGQFTDIDSNHWAFADVIDAAVSHVCYFDEAGSEHWVLVEGEDGMTEDFTPDYEAGEAKKAEVEKLMADRIAAIRAAKNDYADVKGTKYYVSPNGNDANDGKSPATAVATISKGNSLVKSGDALLFERNGEWRGTFTSKAGVTYGAYGEGAKPIINGNLLGDATGEENWTLVEGTENIWKFAKKVNDIGNIVLNREKTFEKIVPTISGTRLLINNKEFDPKTSFKENESFVVIYGSINGDGTDLTGYNSTLYVRCDEGNPGKLYSNIELATKNHTINGSGSNCVYDNLAIMFSGNHGVGGLGGTKNVRFTNCEIGWIGGCAQYYKNGSMTRFGNGVEVYGSCDGYYIDNCYVYQCYDAGVTHQLSSGSNNDCIEQNVQYTNNVIDKCIYNIEYFMGKSDSGDATRLMRNILIKGNILAHSGYGWGMSPSRSACIKGWESMNQAENFVIEENIFLEAAYSFCHIGAEQVSWLPAFKNNTYIQAYGEKLMLYGAGGCVQSNFNGKAMDVLTKSIGEVNPTVYYTRKQG